MCALEGIKLGLFFFSRVIVYRYCILRYVEALKTDFQITLINCHIKLPHLYFGKV